MTKKIPEAIALFFLWTGILIMGSGAYFARSLPSQNRSDLGKTFVLAGLACCVIGGLIYAGLAFYLTCKNRKP